MNKNIFDTFCFPSKVLNCGGSISKGFLNHQIRREKVKEKSKRRSRKKYPQFIFPSKKCWRGYINAAVLVWFGEYVREWVSAWFRNTFPWRRDTDLFFCPITFKLHSEVHHNERINPIDFWLESKVKATVGTLSVKHCGYDTDFCFCPVTLKLHK